MSNTGKKMASASYSVTVQMAPASATITTTTTTTTTYDDTDTAESTEQTQAKEANERRPRCDRIATGFGLPNTREAKLGTKRAKQAKSTRKLQAQKQEK